MVRLETDLAILSVQDMVTTGLPGDAPSHC